MRADNRVDNRADNKADNKADNRADNRAEISLAEKAVAEADMMDIRVGTMAGIMKNIMVGTMNTGMMNTGMMNTGIMNTGIMNTGMMNTGMMNTGMMNTKKDLMTGIVMTIIKKLMIPKYFQIFNKKVFLNILKFILNLSQEWIIMSLLIMFQILSHLKNLILIMMNS